MIPHTILLVAGFADSVLLFRGDLIRTFQARGMTVHVAAPGLGAGTTASDRLMEHNIVPHDIPLRRTGLNPFADLHTLVRLFSLMKDLKPDLVLSYTIKPVIYGSLAAAAARIQRRFALITGLGYAFQSGKPSSLLQSVAQRLYRAALSGIDKVFFQNPDDEILFKERGIVSARTPTCVVNGSGVDVARFPVSPLPPGPPVFLMIGRLLTDKGVREYAAAAKEVKRAHPEARFTLVGWIDSNPSAITEAELHQWIDEGTIEFLGRLDDVRPAIAAASVFVLPSYREGTPRTVLEAMAMGRPIITTDAPGCRETVRHGDNGFLVPVKDAAAFAEAMTTFLCNTSLLDPMARRSREIALEKYDVRLVNEHMLREMGLT